MTLWEKSHEYEFLFGGEESYGYLVGTHARDKDAVVMSAFIAEMTLYYKKQNKTLIDVLHEIYEKFGVFREKLVSLDYPDTKESKDKMTQMIESLRSEPPKEINGVSVAAIEDYKTSKKLYMDSGKEEDISLPESNVLLFWLADKTKLVVRPSGTEPKIKLYCGVVKKESDVEKGVAAADSYIDGLIAAFKKLLD